jgi:hypothetical protein
MGAGAGLFLATAPGFPFDDDANLKPIQGQARLSFA